VENLHPFHDAWRWMMQQLTQGTGQSAPPLGTMLTDPIPVKAPFMPMFSLPILIGGMVAAGLVASQYKPGAHDTTRERLVDLAGIYLKTFAPGVVVSQALFGILKHSYPVIAGIEGIELLIGVVVGGIGMKLLLRLYDRLPEIAESGIVGYLTKRTGSPTTTGAPAPTNTDGTARPEEKQ